MGRWGDGEMGRFLLRVIIGSHGNKVNKIFYRLPTPNSRFPIPDSQFPVPDSRFPIPDSQFPFPSWEGLGVGSDSRFPIPDFSFPR
ncbi:MAG: hypothetical protein F6J94_14205 [Moorea sp. SIO1F2]|uniref:hypothetical protein n=1 Tax=Moorena sp. SIO1F2 TaxID=2607819 RepID=UPI0013B5C9E8|nr:hypothetical protein [Moorena sp. SIO1F2]NET83037.1 hypothetical protein [Moorena sp. SIO1F2]